MTMPEAAVNKNDFSPGNEGQIWPAGQVGMMQPIAESQPMEGAANEQFGLRIPCLHRTHDAGARQRIEHVDHRRDLHSRSKMGRNFDHQRFVEFDGVDAPIVDLQQPAKSADEFRLLKH